MFSVAWPLLVISVLFIVIGLYFYLGRASIVASTKLRREQVNRIRPKNRQLPPSTTTTGRIGGGGIALAIVGVLFLVPFFVALLQK